VPPIGLAALTRPKQERVMIQRAVVFGASSGVGRATAKALAAGGTRVWAVARREAPLATLGAGIEPIIGDATDPAVVARALAAADPDLVVCTVGVLPVMGPVDELGWDDFSAAWHGDLKASFHIGQQTVRRPLRHGSTVVIVSSGAALGGSHGSGGYAGAKRMQMFLAGYLQQLSDTRALGIRYVALAPKQLLAGTAIGERAATVYGGAAGPAAYMTRFGAPLDADGVAATILRIGTGDAPPGPLLAVSSGKGLEAV
jgi:NAD(P)-dependent dehydrogenase (short-subunit alcohol dehydrogenase family)